MVLIRPCFQARRQVEDRHSVNFDLQLLALRPGQMVLPPGTQAQLQA
jgi:hypothetical protein